MYNFYDKIHSVRQRDELLNKIEHHRSKERTIIFTNGCFDILHRGHVEYLQWCKYQAGIVVVGLNSDSSVRLIKGEGRPLNCEKDRAAVLAALASVNYVAVFEQETPIELIKQVRPDILIKGEDWREKVVVGKDFVETYGGKVMFAPLVDGYSSSKTIEHLRIKCPFKFCTKQFTSEVQFWGHLEKLHKIDMNL
jgi:rfaE bifunctional protein nucleotidyltransferase chain/domain